MIRPNTWVPRFPPRGGQEFGYGSLRSGKLALPRDGCGQPPAIAAARAKTASSIGSVSFPVKVFCWLGW
jgi:hypothetical protein